ncbi:MAG: amidase [Rhodobacteraceae bacterium]|nr:amidase [Paracoccaceae bacterium]
MAAGLGLGAAAAGRAIAAGRLDPVDLAESFLAAIAAHPEAARIYARTTPERARGEALAARSRARAGARRGPLDGVPLAWKDLFDTAGIATEAGSRLLAGRIPAADARVLARATAVGLVCLGKTHMTELAFSGLGLNPMTATPPNALDPARLPGGSSSGSGVAVALGLAPAAVGSDTGGSVRLPAVWNGIVGLRTTPGLLPLEGVVPLAPSFDTVGPMTRTVEDAALLLAALGGGAAPALAPGTAGLAGRRLLVLETVALDDLRPEPAAAFETATARLAAAGARLERLPAPEVADALALSGALFAPEAWGIWGKVIEAAPDRMYPPIRSRFRSGAAVTEGERALAWTQLLALRAAWAGRVAGADAVILPTAASLPPDAARARADEAYFAAENLLALRNTRIANLLGLPALTLPAGPPMTGVMLMGPAMGEAALLALGAAAEEALA